MTGRRVDGGSASYAPGSFSDVDASGQSGEHAAYLGTLAGFFAERRRTWFSYLDLRRGEVVLDAGSGMGEVTRDLASMVGPVGRAVGVDLSADLVGRANERAVGTPDLEYRVGDLTDLPFEDATFDAVYCERVFQHLADPDRGIAELFRVLRPGGRVAAIDPDFTRSVQDSNDFMASDILTAAARRVVANPSSGRELRAQLVGAGFIEVDVHPALLVTTDPERFRALTPRSLEDRLDDLVVAGELGRERADAFLVEQHERGATGRFLVSTPLYCITGTKPSG